MNAVLLEKNSTSMSSTIEIHIKKVVTGVNRSMHLRNFINFGLGTGISSVISFITVYILNTRLNEKDMGEYSYIFNILTLVSQIVSLNIYSSYLRFYHCYDPEDLEKKILRFLLLSSVVFVVLVFFIYQNAYLIFFISLIFFEERLYSYRAKLKTQIYNLLNISQKLVFLLLVFYYVPHITENNCYDLVILLLSFSYLFVLLFYFVFTSVVRSTQLPAKSVVHPKIEHCSLLKFSASTTLVLVLNWVLSVSDQIFIKHYFSAEELAPYAVCFKIISMIGLFSGVFISYFPTLYFREFSSRNYRIVVKYRRVFICFLFLTVILLTFMADYVFFAFGADKYIDHTGLFIWLIWGEFFRLVAALYMTFQTYLLKQQNVFFSLFIVALLNVCLNSLFVPTYGAVGAAISTFVSYVVYLIISYIVGFIPEWKYIKQNEV